MKAASIPFEKTGYFSKFICDYISENKSLTELYGYFPTIENFKKQIQEKQESFSDETRKILSQSIENQYKNIETSEFTCRNIQSLRNSNCFTVTTGHQLSLFTGPLYFIYKIVSTINLASLLSKQYIDFQFVPVYWMATEDHDFEEINHFYLNDKKVVWNDSQTGMVGDFSTENLNSVAMVLQSVLGMNSSTEKIVSLFKRSYLENKNLASATRYLVNELFKEYGLVIVDGNAPELKRVFVPQIQKDIFENSVYEQVTKTSSHIKKLDETYPIQVSPREINFFYLQKGSRERLIKIENGYLVNNTSITFTEEELKEELQKHPEKFSPNVIMRPVYQEIILPNLCYIGGGGEIAYWLQLKGVFDLFNLNFPILLLRNSVLLITEKQLDKLKKLNISVEEIFKKPLALENLITQRISEFLLDFSMQKNQLTAQFQYLYEVARQTDPTFLNAVKAQEVKQIKGLQNLEKRLLKAQKRKYHDTLTRVLTLRNELFPNGSLQERTCNFSTYMTGLQGNFINLLIKNLNPLDFHFIILKI